MMHIRKILSCVLCCCVLFSLASCDAQVETEIESQVESQIESQTTIEVTTTTEETLGDLDISIEPSPFFRVDESYEYVQEIDGVTMTLVDGCGCVIVEVANSSDEPFVVDMSYKLYQLTDGDYVELYDAANDISPFYVREIIDGVGDEDVVIDDSNVFVVMPDKTFMIIRYPETNSVDEVGDYRIEISGFELDYKVYEDYAW